MTNNNSELPTEDELQNLLRENPRLAEALLLHKLNTRRFRNLRQLEVLSGFQAKELEEKGVIETYSRGGYLIIDRLRGRTFMISEGTPEQVEDAKQFIREAVEELDSNGIEVPLDLDADDLINECLNNMGAFDEVADSIRFDDSGYASVSEEAFSYPLITRMSKGFKIADGVKSQLNEVLDNLQISPEFAQRYWEVQQDSNSGIFTAISSQTESHHRLIYPKARESDMNEDEIGELLLELEEKMTRGSLNDLEIDEKIQKIQTKEVESNK